MDPFFIASMTIHAMNLLVPGSLCRPRFVPILRPDLPATDGLFLQDRSCS